MAGSHSKPDAYSLPISESGCSGPATNLMWVLQAVFNTLIAHVHCGPVPLNDFAPKSWLSFETATQRLQGDHFTKDVWLCQQDPPQGLEDSMAMQCFCTASGHWVSRAPSALPGQMCIDNIVVFCRDLSDVHTEDCWSGPTAVQCSHSAT